MEFDDETVSDFSRLIETDDFERIDEAVEAGAASARTALPHIRKLLAIQEKQESIFQPGRQGEFLFCQALR